MRHSPRTTTLVNINTNVAGARWASPNPFSRCNMEAGRYGFYRAVGILKVKQVPVSSEETSIVPS